NLIGVKRAGASGVTIAVLDTGVAYTNWGKYKEAPDLVGTKFVDPCDLVAGTIRHGRCTNTHPLDPVGHGTWVTSEIAEATNNGIGLTGLAYGATIMPVRVVGSDSRGNANVMATGVRYAVAHHARVINISQTFQPSVSARQLPALISAIHYAHAHGVVVVAASGNQGAHVLDYPARDPDVISVGATTSDGCLAAYSNTSNGLDLAAPGGGPDAAIAEPQCNAHAERPDVFQDSFLSRRRPNIMSSVGWAGTSMATPAVSAGAAMVIASGVLGKYPHPDQVRARLERTARQLEPGQVQGQHNALYGYGLLDLAAATAR
ncbi:MAG: S8 family serine peptidase, partial [Solirubrobacterales bacterium]|nr:S8 family serine peptidase [Solirubrobacterales bacterium]